MTVFSDRLVIWVFVFGGSDREIYRKYRYLNPQKNTVRECFFVPISRVNSVPYPTKYIDCSDLAYLRLRRQIIRTEVKK